MFSLIDSFTLIAVFGSFVLGIVVLIQNPKKLINITFAIFSFVTAFWIFLNFIFSFYKIEIILQSQYAFGSIIMPAALIWIYILVDGRISIKKTSLISFVALCSFVVAYMDPLFIDRLIVQGNSTIIVTGPFFDYYSIFTLAIFAFFLYELGVAILKTSDIKKIQLKFILAGSLTFGGISMVTSFILPLFKIVPIGPYDAQSSLFFVAFSAYAILKHKLFNLKVIATELLISGIWLFLLVKILLASSLTEVVINVTLFVLMLIFGLLLMKSVIKEVEARERIELLATDLSKANTRLTELDRQKSEFVSFATHQLRAPLTAMKGYASLLIEGDMGKLPDEAKKGVERIFDSTNTLTSIVDDYLNITRIELGTMKYAFETIDLRMLVEDTIAELKPNIDKSGLAFSFKADPPAGGGASDWRITADRDKLKQVIANVIDNSMKYTPKGSITAELSLDRSHHKFVFAVKDTGVGIAPETLPRLFQKFSRADNANKVNIRGTGLGLFVAKQMVEAHHGTIRAESAGEGKGSTFIVELEPLAKV